MIVIFDGTLYFSPLYLFEGPDACTEQYFEIATDYFNHSLHGSCYTGCWHRSAPKLPFCPYGQAPWKLAARAQVPCVCEARAGWRIAWFPDQPVERLEGFQYLRGQRIYQLVDDIQTINTTARLGS